MRADTEVKVALQNKAYQVVKELKLDQLVADAQEVED